MLEKLIQAALITFLLHLIVGLRSHTPIPTKGVTPISEISTTVISSTWNIAE
jgi:hypothetical protein